jgi:hypothetical protein
VGTISTNKVCPASNDITEMQIQSGDTFKIKSGCYVHSMDHIISADESETIEVKIKAMDWPGEITDLFHHRNKEAIHQDVQGVRTRYNGKFDATILLDQLNHLETPDLHCTFTSPSAMIRAAICTFAVGICLWRLCCRAPTLHQHLLHHQYQCQSSLHSHQHKNQPPTTELYEAAMQFPLTSPSPKGHQGISKKKPRRRGEISEMIYL